LWTAICPISGSGLSPACCQPICLSRLCLLKYHEKFISLLLSPSLVQQLVGHLLFQASFTKISCRDLLLALPFFSCVLSDYFPICCMSFSVPCVLFSFVFFFSVGWGSVCPGVMLVYPRGRCGNTTCCLFAHLLVCISQAGLVLVSGDERALLFSQCDMVWRGFA
jgi:hypothetical protein